MSVSGAFAVLMTRTTCGANSLLSTAELSTGLRVGLCIVLRAGYPQSLFTAQVRRLGSFWPICPCASRCHMWITGLPPGTMAVCFASSGFQLRGYPCQWNFGSSAWSFCAMNCLPSNSTPGSVRYRSKPKATSCASMRPTVSFSIGSTKSTWAVCSSCWASVAMALRLPFPY